MLPNRLLFASVAWWGYNTARRVIAVAATAFVRARIDEEVKNEASEVLAAMGLTISDAVRISLTRIAKEKALPFDLRMPNKLTAETLAKSERGEDMHHAKDAKDLFDQLGI